MVCFRYIITNTLHKGNNNNNNNNNNGVQGVAWINLVQETDHWWAVVHVVYKESLDSIISM